MKIIPSTALFLLVASIIVGGCGPKTDQQQEPIQETQPTIPVTDTEGNVYPTVKIGRQTWMAKNLSLTHPVCEDSVEFLFTNGIERGPTVKFYDGKSRYAYYNNAPQKGFGVIYSYKAITDCDLCPSGYRIPTKADFEELVNTLGGYIPSGEALLAGGSSGFDARMVGRIDAYGSVLEGIVGFWWSIDESYQREQVKKVYVFEVSHKGGVRLVPQDYRVGNYVRCIKEEEP